MQACSLFYAMSLLMSFIQQMTPLCLLLMLSALKTIELELPLEKEQQKSVSTASWVWLAGILCKPSHAICTLCQSISFYLL